MAENKMTDHLDKSVIRSFLIVFLVSVSVLAYRVTKYTPCKQVEFRILSDSFEEQTLIEFKDKTANASSWEWDYGDGTKKGTSREALHSYDKPGEYNVTLTINGICNDIQQVVVKKKPFVKDTAKLPVFVMPQTIKAGETLTVVDKTNNASTWEWNFGVTGGINSKKRTAKYVYEEPGLYTVALVVNGDVKHVSSKQITVTEKEKVIAPPEKKIVAGKKPEKFIGGAPKGGALGAGKEISEAPKTIPYMSDTEFKYKLNLVAKKKLQPSVFKEHFCGDLDKKILVNGNRTTFLEFCELIKSKNLKVKEVRQYRQENNCIKDITISRSKYLIK